MARTGRPPKPLEQKRATGRSPGRDSGGRKLPEPSTVVVLPMAAGTPQPPGDLLIDGRQLWERAWATAITWLSPDSDMQAVENACRLADDVSVIRGVFRVTRDPAHLRGLVAASKLLQEALSSLGFDPTARSRLGVAEVKRVSGLEKLLEQKRQAKSSARR